MALIRDMLSIGAGSWWWAFIGAALFASFFLQASEGEIWRLYVAAQSFALATLFNRNRDR